MSDISKAQELIGKTVRVKNGAKLVNGYVKGFSVNRYGRNMCHLDVEIPENGGVIVVHRTVNAVGVLL